MPIITVKVASQKKEAGIEERIASFVVDASTTTLRKKRELTAVTVEEVDTHHWFAGGPSLAEQHKSSFWLDIKTVDGTNTKEEKAAFVAEIFRGMGELLGSLHDESYVYVDEVRADAYGFGGKTQEYRYVANQLR
jgi:4-oxalocrotonate tautomerase